MSEKDKKDIDPQEKAEDIIEDAAATDAPKDPFEALQAERDDLFSRLQRLSADYMNFQKRAAREKSEARDYIIGDVTMAFAEVLDDLELALNHARENHDDNDPLLAGTDMVYKKAMEVFKRFNVEPIDSIEKPFDPSLHEALQMQPTDQAEPMTILYEIRKGYKLKDRTIRPSRVVVAAAPVEESSDSSEESNSDQE